MPGNNPWTFPYTPDFSHLAVDGLISFVVSALLAIMVNAEAQAWVATLLGDTRPGAKDRFHFNAFLHLSFLGSLCYLAGGFGWPKVMEINPTRFKNPRLYTLLARLAGPLANIFMANIAASIIFLFKQVNADPVVFLMVLGVNATTAVCHLLPIPPLALGLFLTDSLPDRVQRLKGLLNQVGPVLIVGTLLAERITGQGLISPYLNPLVQAAVKFITG
jgi:Zn-dependent protease